MHNAWDLTGLHLHVHRVDTWNSFEGVRVPLYLLTSILFVQEVIKLTKDLMELAPQVCCDMGSSHTIVVSNIEIIVVFLGDVYTKTFLLENANFSLHFGLPFTLKRWKRTMKTQTIESGDQSGNFENGDSKNAV